MRIERSASFGIPFGEISTDWHTPEFDKNLRLHIIYHSHDSDGERNYPGSVLDVASNFYGLDMSTAEREAAVVNIRSATREIDDRVRQYRGYEDSLGTKITVDYRVGLGRGTGLINELLALLMQRVNVPFGFDLPGPPHFDKYGAPDDATTKDTIVVTHRGRSTVIYEGPIYHGYFARSGVEDGDPSIVDLLTILMEYTLFAPIIGRLSTGRRVRAENDQATLLNLRSLHRQPGGFYSTAHPPVWLRTIVQPQEPSV